MPSRPMRAAWAAGEAERKRRYIAKGLIEALEALEDIGIPAIIRPSFTLAGTGGGIAFNKQEFLEIVERGLDASPTTEVLIEESVLGWKEFEMEVVRDKADNCIIVCSIENFDPMGVHTGDSITVAPALTLTDKEFQIMRDASIAVLREIGVETGGSNVQFAVNPGRRPPRRHRDEPAGVAVLGAGVQGDRLSHRQGRRQARGRLHPRRDRQRHHRRRDPGLVRADHRLRRHQGAALRLREIPRRRAGADDLDEVGGRGDGDRAHLPGIAAEGAAIAGDRPDRARRDQHQRPRRRRRQERHPRRARGADARPHPGDRAGDAARHVRRDHQRRLQDRSVVPRGDARHRRDGSGDRRQGPAAARRAPCGRSSPWASPMHGSPG